MATTTEARAIKKKSRTNRKKIDDSASLRVQSSVAALWGERDIVGKLRCGAKRFRHMRTSPLIIQLYRWQFVYYYYTNKRMFGIANMPT